MTDFRSLFPIFQYHPDLVYLDNAATMQKPRAVIDVVSTYYSTQNSNIHRGAYDIAIQSEKLYEQSKDRVVSWIGAASRQEIIYTQNATLAFNLLARSLADSGMLQRGDRVLLSVSEHHSNIVPWQMLAKAQGIGIDFVDIDKEGCIDLGDLQQKISEKTKVVSLTAVSNVLGSINDLSGIRKVIDASWFHPLFVVDATQALPHFPVNVAEIGCDFLIFTGHKIMAETGIGVLYGKKELLASLTSSIGGGGSIQQVTKEGFITGPVPDRFEAGTPHVAGAASLLASLDFIQSIGGYSAIQRTEEDLMEYMITRVKELHSIGFSLLGKSTFRGRIPVFSFVSPFHPLDLADVLAERNIAVRAGHHCADVLVDYLGVSGTLRASMSFYNTKDDIDRLIQGLKEAADFLPQMTVRNIPNSSF